MEKDFDSMTDDELNAALAEEGQQTETAPAPVASVETEQQTVEPIQQVDAEVTAPKVESDTTSKHVEADREVVGLRNEAIHQRERRRQAESELAELRAKLAAIEVAKVQTAPKAEQFEIDDENVVDGKLFKQTAGSLSGEIKKLQERLEASERAANQIREERENERFARLESETRSAFSVEKVNEGLDYDTVITNFTIPRIKADPNIADLIRRSPNPSEMAYRIGLSLAVDPMKVAQKVAPQVASGVPAKKPAPVTLGQIQAGAGAKKELSGKDISSMSDKELDEALLG